MLARSTISVSSLHLLGQAVLLRLGQEGVVVVALQHQEDGVGAGLADLGDVGRIVLGAGRREDLADELLLGLRRLLLEDLHAVVAPGVVEPQRIELLQLGAAQVERHRARAHRTRDVGAEEVRHQALGGQPAVAVVGRDEDRVPFGELRHHRQGLRRQRDAGQQAAVAALHHLLRLAHAVGGIAGGVLDQQLDRPSEDAALGVLDLGPELGAALLLLARPSRARRSAPAAGRS